MFKAVTGEAARERDAANEWLLCGVEFDAEDSGEDVVRVRDGVRMRGTGLRKETLRILLKGDAWGTFKPYSNDTQETARTFGSDLRLTEYSCFCVCSASDSLGGKGELVRLTERRASANDKPSSSS